MKRYTNREDWSEEADRPRLPAPGIRIGSAFALDAADIDLDRADLRPDEDLLVVILDGWPVPEINYTRMVETAVGEAGDLVELLALISEIHDADGDRTAATRLRIEAATAARDAEAGAARRVEALGAANSKRAAEAMGRLPGDVDALREAIRCSPGASSLALQRKLKWGWGRLKRAKDHIENDLELKSDSTA